MPLTRVFGFVLSGVLVITVLSSVSSAQLRNRQPLFRWLGQGFGDGYHQCNPGPNSDYYNPYSAHNSLLHSQTNPDGFQDNYGVPHPVYSAPTHGRIQFETSPGQVIDSTFDPLDPARSRTRQTQEFITPPNAGGSNKVETQNGNSALLIRGPGQTRISPTGASQTRAFSKAGFRTGPRQSPRVTNLFKPFRNEK